MGKEIVWQEQVSQEAMADGELTLYSDRIPPGHIGCVRVIAARGNAANTGEMISLGIEVNGVKHKLYAATNTYTDTVTSFAPGAYLKENDRVFAEFEAANDDETLTLTVNGYYEKV